ncbi:enoyl-CoA hydratase [Halalkalibacter wakoensis JCM 9140]|uniref:Enoyl-CoA hydratase n=1 Tax=Halalkalibacter wakoensis JCM 9140 TaxID=1236970 RepID=W4Q603_9BACI|nr:enoyl-CoA hydratase/isomerase family protein [Halalkalibacter wakoensis]GAE27390.1 enoyl-CoA hydratase [Halalkalibacter wakoensis JCM 9140]
MWRELKRIGLEIKANPKNKVVIVRGITGDFTAGSDIKEFCEMSVDEANEAFRLMEETISTFESLPIPVIGAIDGPTLGAGFVFSLAFDIRVGTPNTRMGIPVGRLGIKLGPTFVQRISRLIGPSRTKELVMTNEIYDYQRSYDMGLVNKVVSSEDLDKYALDLAKMISKQSRASMKAVKKSANMTTLPNDIEFDFVDPVDFHEGCLAFVEKRKPNFQ